MPINVKYPHCGIANMNIRSSEKTTETSYSVGVYFDAILLSRRILATRTGFYTFQKR